MRFFNSNKLYEKLYEIGYDSLKHFDDSSDYERNARQTTFLEYLTMYFDRSAEDEIKSCETGPKKGFRDPQMAEKQKIWYI
jgi:hypothetical protein